MRDIPASAVTAAVKALCVPANNQLPPDVEAAVRGAYESEPWPIAKQTLGTLCQNLDAARATGHSRILADGQARGPGRVPYMYGETMHCFPGQR